MRSTSRFCIRRGRSAAVSDDRLTFAARAGDIDPAALQGFLDEQIYTLPGTDRPHEEFSILLTGSRATGMYEPESDVDVDVVCPQTVYEAVRQACLAAGIVQAPDSFFCYARGDDPHRYFGPERGYPHFSLAPLELVARQFREYRDVALWVWTNAQVIIDPGEQFARLLPSPIYSSEVLVRKLKYHWLRASYAAIDIFPNHPRGDRDLLPAVSALTDTINDFLRLFCLVEGKPFPYTEKLMPYAARTHLGEKWCPFFQELAEMIVGTREADRPAWDRLHRARELLIMDEELPEPKALWEDCDDALIAAGVDPAWVEADFANIGELLSGKLGPAP